MEGPCFKVVGVDGHRLLRFALGSFSLTLIQSLERIEVMILRSWHHVRSVFLSLKGAAF